MRGNTRIPCTLITLLLLTPLTLGFTATTKTYPDITENGFYWLDPESDPWDLTRCDLTISYTLDMSEYLPPMWNTQWSSVGVGGGAWGWMSSGAPAAYETNPNSQDIDDKLNLGAPDRWDESSYDATGPETLVTPPIGNPWINYAVWFDRDGVDQWQANNWGMKDGVTYNTGGIYNVVITLHAIDETTGTMFATVNGEPQGFYDTWKNDEPDYWPVGKSITGDMTRLRVFASIWGENVRVYNIIVEGCPYWTEIELDIKPGSYPNSINLRSRGVVPVAVLSTDDFDAATIDPTTVTFAGAEPWKWNMEDVNEDGAMDMVFHFKTQDLDLSNSSESATLMGETTDGKHIKGTDSVNIVPR